jgi:hypothetical protein
MRYGLPLSVFFHGLLLALVLIGLPVFSKPLTQKSVDVPVEIVRFDDLTNPPPGHKIDPQDTRKPDDDRTTAKDKSADGGRTRPLAQPEKAPKQKADAALKTPTEAPSARPITPRTDTAEAAPRMPEVPPVPKPPKLDMAKPKAAPKAPAAPERDEAALRPPAPQTKPAPEKSKQEQSTVKSHPTFRPDLPAPEKEAKKTEQAKAKPEVKSKPTYVADRAPEHRRESEAKRPAHKPSRLDSVFRDLDRDRKAPQQADADRTSRDRRNGDPSHRRGAPLTISEIDAVKRQIRRCWNVDAGAKDLASLTVTIEVWMNRDGTVREARIAADTHIRNAVHRAAAESALRAVENERCQPYPLPSAKYGRWEHMKLEFDPSEG